jgi:two-component system response regulator YesN
MRLKLLLAEDEQIERSALKFIISNYLPCFEIAAEATNGFELLEFSRLHEPDVIVIDIKMPGIDGISAITEIKKFLHDVEFLFISAHTNFEFAQSAIQLGASGYLTKPIKNSQLIDVLNMLYDKITDRHTKKTLDQKLNEKIKMFKPQMEDNILHAIAFTRINSAISDQFDRFWDTNTGKYFFILAVQNNKNSFDLDKQKTLAELFRKNLYAICSEFIMGFINGDLLVLLPYQSNEEKYESNAYQKEIADYLKTCFHDAQFPAKIFISRIVSNLHSLSREYRKFQEQFFLQNNSEKFIFKNTISELYSWILSLCEKITSGDTKASIDVLNKIMLCIQSETNGRPEEERKYLEDIYTTLKSFIFSNKDAYNLFNDLFSDLQACIEKTQDTKQMFDKILNIVISSADYYEKKNLSTVDYKINSIIEYICKNYTADNSLESLAKQYNLNTSYLSKVFKQRYGKNFIDFITELRIERAKQLLTTTNKSIKEITYEIGYNSQTYFCKVFKKAAGISASEYKQKGGHITT